MSQKQRRKIVEKEPSRIVFDKNKSEKAQEEGIPRIWQPFGKDEEGNETEACFWGLTYEEGLIARRLGSKIRIGPGPDYQKEIVADPDKLPLIYVIMSARAGDSPEYAFNPATGEAKTLLNWPEDAELLQRLCPGGRIQVLFELVDQLSVVSLSTLMGHYRFFGALIVFLSGFRNSVLPSIEEALKTSSIEKVRDILALIEPDLKDLEDFAVTLLRGSPSRVKSFDFQVKKIKNGGS